MTSLATPSRSRLGPALDPPRESGRRALDADLIRRSLAGDAGASRELHRHYYPIVSSFLRKLGTQPHELEDACQEVFTLFFRHVFSSASPRNEPTWRKKSVNTSWQASSSSCGCVPSLRRNDDTIG